MEVAHGGAVAWHPPAWVVGIVGSGGHPAFPSVWAFEDSGNV